MKLNGQGPFRGILDSLGLYVAPPEPVVIFEGDSEFNHIVVKDSGDIRTLCMGPSAEESETAISLSDPHAGIFEYPGLMFMSLALSERNKHVLMLGLGGGFIPKLFQEYLPEQRLTVVEIDPLVGEVASVYFGFQPGKNVELVYADGGDFLASTEPESFDQIWLDAFNGNYIPPHLATEEFLKNCLDALVPCGILTQNLHQTRIRNFHTQVQRTKRLLGAVPLILNGERCSNSVCISLKSPEPFDPSVKELLDSARKFKTSIGPYNMLDEARKKKKGDRFFDFLR
jgi:spermidine synthase